MDLNSLRHVAKEILAAAALELFPGTRLAGGAVDEIGFHYDLIFPKERLSLFTEKELLNLEDRMIQIIHEGRPIKALEMMRENAAAYLEHLGQPMRAQAALDHPLNITSLIEIGAFRDLCPGPFIENTRELKAFKLQGFHAEGERIRIFGTAFFARKELKEFLKHYKEAARRDPLVIGPKEGYFFPYHGQWIYREKGLKLLQPLKDFWEKEHADFEKIAFSDLLDPKEVHASLKNKNKIASLSLFKGDFVTIKCADAEELAEARISSLQFIEKAFKLLPFDRKVQAVETSPAEEIAFRVQDGYGRERTLSYIEVERKKNVLRRSLFYSLREWVAHMIEMGVEIEFSS